jgi:hypothetical protein
MLAVNYERLERIVQIEKPFRGNVNRYPIGNRKHNTKCFYQRHEGDAVVFDVTYGYKYERNLITNEEYDTLMLAGANEETDRIRKTPKWDTNADGWSKTEFDYYTYSNPPNVLGTVRPDNTFEFNEENTYHQGERHVLSTWSRGYFTNDSRRGGLIYRVGYNPINAVMPIWKGMRVDCETMRPTQDYQVFTKQVDRKASKELMAPYKDFYTTAEVMFKAMDWATFIRVAGDVHTQYKPETNKENDHHAFNLYGSIAERVKDTSPIDAAILFMLQMDNGNLRWDTLSYLRDGNVRTSRGHESPEELFINMKRSINKFIYRAHQETFKRVEHTAGAPFPAGDWGVEVIVDGKQVEQYGYGL